MQEVLEPKKRPVGSLPPSKSPTGQAPPRRSVCAPGRCPTHCIADHIAKEIPMWFNNFVKSVTATSSRRRLTRRRPSPARLCLEALEDRCVPSAYSIIPLPLSPQDVNAHGQIVGQMSGSSAALWQNGTLTNLGSLAGPGGWSIAYGI